MYMQQNYNVYIVLQARHAVVCQKAISKKRKVFDSSRQRAEGTDIPMLKPMKPKVWRFSVATPSNLCLLPDGDVAVGDVGSLMLVRV